MNRPLFRESLKLPWELQCPFPGSLIKNSMAAGSMRGAVNHQTEGVRVWNVTGNYSNTGKHLLSICHVFGPRLLLPVSCGLRSRCSLVKSSDLASREPRDLSVQPRVGYLTPLCFGFLSVK